jgi:hypothetical protein
MKIIAGKIETKQKRMVEFIPAPVLVNGMIENLNKMGANVPPQEFASFIASQIAALAFVMHSANDTETITRLFSAVVEDAGKQFEYRKKLMEKEQSSIIRLP